MMESGVTEKEGDGWDEFVKSANEFMGSEKFKRDIDSLLKCIHKVAEARAAVLDNDDNWADSVKKNGLTGKFVFFMVKGDFLKWISESPDAALKAIKEIWTENEVSVDQRIRTFCKRFPREAVGGGVGTRMTVAAQLLMGQGLEHQFPPFSIRKFKKAYRRTGYELPKQNADEATQYTHALGFLDKLIEESAAHELNLRHRLDAFVVAWNLVDRLPAMDTLPHDRNPLGALANKLLLPAEFLQEIDTLLDEKRQVIFQGPPGTGKTYIAQKLANCLSGSQDRVTLVQFHPSYAYEDFVRGFRPALNEGQVGFDLQDGPLIQSARKAQAEAHTDPDAKHFLIIDEINRGNLAKVFGELYFLLEYRDKKIRMQYQREGEEDFSLPSNLYIIGTMNTADRSIALVDSALRRRFYFIEFHPGDEPVRSVLLNWLGEGSEMAWVADVVHEANELLKDDKHAAIGPSYFMIEDLDEDDVRRIWKHSVLPYVEERLFGNEDRIGEFDLDKLRNKANQTRKSKENAS